MALISDKIAHHAASHCTIDGDGDRQLAGRQGMEGLMHMLSCVPRLVALTRVKA
jgi:hypothetical protein